MLADAKLPVTFWAEAVNTAYYVQNKVLVNKSHNKTPYELLNGRSPAIGFLKPFRCHVMILNTLDHLGKFKAKGDEGTNSTNLLGIKDAASQEVKKDVSSLRYIALPKWVYDALLESSLSKPQDDCCIDVPESIGNSNPTTTSTNPSADQIETLTVETPIPTVSLPILTACFTDSQEPSNILGVTTNLDESNGVEADESNMETTITASPTPTLRIHKDHPKNPSWVEAMQEELLQFKIQNVWTLVDCPKGEERINYDEVFTAVARIEAIRLFLAYASFMDFTVYQMDVKSAFLYGTID
nr:retrovirus-related Pol polyprotein from transposon TNT 1-94 [Tanacetum cinerariifolium]